MSCCHSPRLEVHDGFYICVHCATVLRPHLCPTDSHNNNVLKRETTLVRQPYCRAKRYLRLLKRICGRGSRIPDSLILFCEKYRPRSYSEVQYLVRIYRRESGQKPIGYAQIPSLYRILTGERLPLLTPEEIDFLVMTFNEIDFHARKMQERFAFNFIIRRIFELPHVHRRIGKERCHALRDLVKPLACQVRCARYYKLLNTILKKIKIFSNTLEN